MSNFSSGILLKCEGPVSTEVCHKLYIDAHISHTEFGQAEHSCNQRLLTQKKVDLLSKPCRGAPEDRDANKLKSKSKLDLSVSTEKPSSTLAE